MKRDWSDLRRDVRVSLGDSIAEPLIARLILNNDGTNPTGVEGYVWMQPQRGGENIRVKVKAGRRGLLQHNVWYEVVLVDGELVLDDYAGVSFDQFPGGNPPPSLPLHDHESDATGGKLDINAATAGTLADARLSSNVLLTNVAKTVSALLTFASGMLHATSATLITPIIASFANATHNHQNAAGGGTLNASAVAAGTLDSARLPNTAVTPGSYTSADLTVDAHGRVTAAANGAGGGGAAAFTDLTDAPSSYAGQAGKFPVVNPSETGLNFASAGTGGADVTDGSVTVAAASTIRFPFGTIVDNGSGEAEYIPSAGGARVRAEIPIYESVLGTAAASIDITSIPQDGDDLVFYLLAKSTTTGATTANLNVIFNNDTTAANYLRQNIAGQNNATSAGEASAATVPAVAASNASNLSGAFSLIRGVFPAYASTSYRRIVEVDYGYVYTSGEAMVGKIVIGWSKSSGATDALTRLTLTLSAGNFEVGTRIVLCKSQYIALGQGSLPISTANISNPPTDAELDTAFGTPAIVGAGYTALINDNGAGSNVYVVASDGVNWWQSAMTKAT